MDTKRRSKAIKEWSLVLIIVCLIVWAVIGISYYVFPGEWRVTNEVDRAIRECLPGIEAFMEKNRTLLDEALSLWEESEFRQEVEFPTNKLYYTIPPVNDSRTADDTSEIPEELIEIFDRLEGDETEWVSVSLEPDGILLGWGFRTYVDIYVFHSERWKNQWYHEGQGGNYDLGGGWYVCFFGVLRG